MSQSSPSSDIISVPNASQPRKSRCRHSSSLTGEEQGEGEKRSNIEDQKSKTGNSHPSEDCFLVVTAGSLTCFWILTCRYPFYIFTSTFLGM